MGITISVDVSTCVIDYCLRLRVFILALDECVNISMPLCDNLVESFLAHIVMA